MMSLRNKLSRQSWGLLLLLIAGGLLVSGHRPAGADAETAAAPADLYAPRTAVVSMSTQWGAGRHYAYTVPAGRALAWQDAAGYVSLMTAADTFAADQPATMTFSPAYVNPAPAGQTPTAVSDAPATAEPAELLRFALNADAADFQKPVQVALDLRSFGYDVDRGGDFYLARRDETQPGRWVEAPLTVHQTTGLVTAAVAQGGDWTAGWRPEQWVPHWELPAPSLFSGSLNYVYPIDVPAGRGGLQPAVSIAYSSSALNGATRSANKGMLATGWSLNTGAKIVRTGVELADGSSHVYNYPHQYRLVINGQGHELIESAGNPGTFHVKNAPQMRVVNVGGYSLDDAESYWHVYTGDGRTYRLGKAAQAQTIHQYELNNDGERREITAWHVDKMLDRFENVVRFGYDNDTATQGHDMTFTCPWNGALCTLSVNTFDARPTVINYNYKIGTTQPTSQLLFGYDESGAVPKLNAVYVYHGKHTRSYPLRKYVLNVGNQDVMHENPDCTYAFATYTRLLNGITEFGYDNGSPVPRPATTFTYSPYPNYEKNGDTCFTYEYLSGVHNGIGGSAEFTYLHDSRVVGEYTYTKNDESITRHYPQMGYNYRVIQTEYDDGRDNISKIEYGHRDVCYNQTESPGCPQGDEAPDYGNIGGFGEVSVTRYDLDGNPVQRTVKLFNQDEDRFGKPAVERIGTPVDGNFGVHVHRKVENEYAVDPFTTDVDGDPVTFTYMSQTVSHEYDDGENSPSISHKTTYQYNHNYQGGAQHGQLTHTRQYDSVAATEPYRTVIRSFVPNYSRRLVTFVASEQIIDNDNSDAGVHDFDVLKLYYYDNHDRWDAAPLNGQLTRVRKTVNGRCTSLPSCTYDTVDSALVYDDYNNLIQRISYIDYGRLSLDDKLTVLTDEWADDELVANIDYDADYRLYPIRTDNGVHPATTAEIYGFTTAADGGLPGQLKSVAVPNTIERPLYEYDIFGRLIHVYFHDAGSRPDSTPDIVHNYLDTARPLAVHTWTRQEDTATVWGDGGSWSRAYYDGLARPIQTHQPAEDWQPNGGHDIVQYTEYDAFDRPVLVSAPYERPAHDFAGSGSGYRQPDLTQPANVTNYDAFGRVTTAVTFDSDTVVQYEYGINAAGISYETMLDGLRHRSQHHFNSRGQMVAALDFTGDCHDNYWSYNCGGVFTTPWVPYGTMQFEYDSFDRMTRVVDEENNVTTMSYDDLGRKIGLDDPDMGAWQYEYDALSNLVEQTDAQTPANRVCFYYDGLNRVSGKATTAGSACPTTQPARTDTAWAADYIYNDNPAENGLGQLTAVNWRGPDDNHETFGYDKYGRLEVHRRVINGHRYTFQTQTFDRLDRPTVQIYPNGESVTVGYDLFGANTLDVSGTDLVTDLSYNEHGRPVQLSRGIGVNTVYDYYDAVGPDGNNNFRLASITHDSAAVPDYAYEYDEAGNMTAIEESWYQGGVLHNQTQSFSYDALDRLATASAPEVTANDGRVLAEGYNRTYDYDPLGNIETLTAEGIVHNYDYAGSGGPHAVSSVTGGVDHSFDYDNNGNMISRNDEHGSFTQVFDAENRLTAVTEDGATTRFYYDPNGQRTMIINPDGTVTYYPFPFFEEDRLNDDAGTAPPPPTPGPDPTPLPSPSPTATPVPAPSVSLTVNGQTAVSVGDNDTLTFNWSSSNAVSCAGLTDLGQPTSWDGSKALSGSENQSPLPAASVTYMVRCENSAGETAEDTVMVHRHPVINSFAVNNKGRETVSNGETYAVNWTSTYATGCTVSGHGFSGTTYNPDDGRNIVAPADTTVDYTLTCTNSHGVSRNASARVTAAGTILHQAITRNGQGYYQRVPVDGDTIEWNLAGEWDAATSDVCGSQDVTAHSLFVIGNKLHQSVWCSSTQTTQKYIVHNIAANGEVNWNSSTWQTNPFAPPVTSIVTPVHAQAVSVLGNSAHHSLWQADSGHLNEWPISNGSVQWGSYGKGGSHPAGQVIAQTFYQVGDTFYQAYWHDAGTAADESDDVGTVLTYNIVNGTVDFNNPVGTSTQPMTGNLPGSGPYAAQAVTVIESSQTTAVPAAQTAETITAKTDKLARLATDDGIIIGETGTAVNVTHQPRTVQLSRSYNNPVVFAQPVSTNGADTAVVRITNVSNDRFTMFVHEAPDRDGPHAGETIHYVVLEAGAWTLESGALLEVGTVDTDQTLRVPGAGWEAVAFTQPFAGTPIIISQVQTNNDATWVKTRHQNWESSTNFLVALEQAEGAKTAHGAETVGWMAISPGVGSWNGRAYDAATTPDAVTHNWYPLTFNAVFQSAPVFVGGITGRDGGDPAALRYDDDSLTAVGVSVFIEEDGVGDIETRHTPERVSYLAIDGEGLLTAVDNTEPTGPAIVQRVTYSLAGTPIAQRTLEREADGTPIKNTLRYLYADHLGSITTITDESGNVAERMRFRPFGGYRTAPTKGMTELGYTGHHHNDDLGLIYMNARYYLPGTGRFASADTIVPQATDPQSWNRYSYVRNSPLTRIDPTGHKDCHYMTAGCNDKDALIYENRSEVTDPDEILRRMAMASLGEDTGEFFKMELEFKLSVDEYSVACKIDGECFIGFTENEGPMSFEIVCGVAELKCVVSASVAGSAEFAKTGLTAGGTVKREYAVELDLSEVNDMIKNGTLGENVAAMESQTTFEGSLGISAAIVSAALNCSSDCKVQVAAGNSEVAEAQVTIGFPHTPLKPLDEYTISSYEYHYAQRAYIMLQQMSNGGSNLGGGAGAQTYNVK